MGGLSRVLPLIFPLVLPRVLPAILLAPLLVGPSPVRALGFDLARATCADLMAAPARERPRFEVWLHGYYAGAAGRTTVERARIEEAAAGLEALCGGRADLPLVGAEVRAVMLGTPSPPAPAAGAAGQGSSQGSSPGVPPAAAPASPAVPSVVEPGRRTRPAPLR